MICPLTTAGSVMSVVGRGRIARPSRDLCASTTISGSGFWNSGSRPTKNAKGLEIPRGVSTRISRGPGAASAASVTSHRHGVGRSPDRFVFTICALWSGSPLRLIWAISLRVSASGLFLESCCAFCRSAWASLLPHGLDVFHHLGRDAVPGEVRLKDVDLIISLPGAQKLPADRDQERRALSAASRKDVADSRILLSRRNRRGGQNAYQPAGHQMPGCDHTMLQVACLHDLLQPPRHRDAVRGGWRHGQWQPQRIGQLPLGIDSHQFIDAAKEIARVDRAVLDLFPFASEEPTTCPPLNPPPATSAEKTLP